MVLDVVVGAGGKTGQQTVKRLLDLGGSVRAVGRNPDTLRDVLPESSKLELVKGDVTDASSLTPCFRGARGVVFTASGKGYWSADAVDCKVSVVYKGDLRCTGSIRAALWHQYTLIGMMPALRVSAMSQQQPKKQASSTLSWSLLLW